MEKQKLMILGSCGFFMGNLIRKAIYEKHPYSFVSIDRVSSNATNSMYWNKNHTFHIADIRDPHVIDVIFQFEKPDIVIHGAEEEYSENNSFISSNVLGTQIIIDACLKHKVKKLIYVSTYKTYGELITPNSSFSEIDKYNPINSFAATKLSSEMLIQAACYERGLCYNIVRTSNNYGPRQNHNKLIPKTIKCILNNEKIPIYCEGKQERDWIHVFDSCSGILHVLNNGKNNEIYNISSGQQFSNVEVVQKICNTLKRGHELMSFEDGPKKALIRSSNSSKLRELGWTSSIKLSDGLTQTCGWYNSNLWWFKQ